MPEYSFTPTLSTNEIFRGNDQTRFLTNDLDTIESDISALESGKANANHTHEGYAAASHTHSGYAQTNHNHDSNYIAKALQMVGCCYGLTTIRIPPPLMMQIL